VHGEIVFIQRLASWNAVACRSFNTSSSGNARFDNREASVYLWLANSKPENPTHHIPDADGNLWPIVPAKNSIGLGIVELAAPGLLAFSGTGSTQCGQSSTSLLHSRQKTIAAGYYINDVPYKCSGYKVD